MIKSPNPVSSIEHPVSLPTYPARPVNGGPLDKAPPKHGNWTYEPKVNGWRTLVHLPTSTMFNRKGERLSIASQFDTLLHLLEDAVNDPALEWLDCEAFERRHPLGKGSLVALDAPLAPGDYESRQQRIYNGLFEDNVGKSWRHEHEPPPENSLLSFAYSYADEPTQRKGIHLVCGRNTIPTVATIDPDIFPQAAWTRLQVVNRALGCDLFEGLVAKRADSIYPIQLRSPDVEFPFWVKHRWKF